MPGVIVTNLQRHMDRNEWIKRGWADKDGKILFKTKTVEAGAATSVWAATSPDLEGKGGLYLEDCQISKQCDNMSEIFKHMFGFMAYAVDDANADKLWRMSEERIEKATKN